jgi:hypothetical protein
MTQTFDEHTVADLEEEITFLKSQVNHLREAAQRRREKAHEDATPTLHVDGEYVHDTGFKVFTVAKIFDGEEPKPHNLEQVKDDSYLLGLLRYRDSRFNEKTLAEFKSRNKAYVIVARVWLLGMFLALYRHVSHTEIVAIDMEDYLRKVARDHETTKEDRINYNKIYRGNAMDLEMIEVEGLTGKNSYEEVQL